MIEALGIPSRYHEAMFREAIIARLEARGWTQYRLVQESGVSKTAVYEYLAGKRDISASKLEQICDVLDFALKFTKKRTWLFPNPVLLFRYG